MAHTLGIVRHKTGIDRSSFGLVHHVVHKRLSLCVSDPTGYPVTPSLDTAEQICGIRAKMSDVPHPCNKLEL